MPRIVSSLFRVSCGGQRLARNSTTALLLCSSLVAWATETPLAQAFATAWAHQPEAQSATARREALRAAQDGARRWTPEPPVLETSVSSDRPWRRQGAQSLDIGVAVPLWLPGQRQRSQALADAEAVALESQQRAAQWHLAATLREAWWAWQQARLNLATARDQLDNHQRLATDVRRRVAAGELARADQHQAEGAVAAAQAAVAQAQAELSQRVVPLQALLGTPPDPALEAQPEPLPETPAADPEGRPALPEDHPALAPWRDQARAAEQAAALIDTESRANPELTVGLQSDRGTRGERYDQRLVLGVRWPFGTGSRHVARQHAAQAEAQQAWAQLEQARLRLLAEREASAQRLAAARAQLAASQTRQQLAQELRSFVEKAFKLGESDLPTRLRAEAESAEATRQHARSRIELAAALSAWRQALGLLPQ